MIRPAGAGDAMALAALWNPFIRDTAVTFSTAERSPADIVQMIDSRRAAGFEFLVAEHQGQLAGFASYAQFRAGPGYATCMEHTIILAPAASGLGLGRALMVALEDHARRGGAHQMIAGVSGENAAGLAFHARLGYAEIARVTEAGFKFGRFMDLVLMRKFL